MLLILDLDGVLITNPTWRADEIDSDGYSRFNQSCIENLNQLLSRANFEIWLSSARRTVKSLGQFNRIFEYRKIRQPIHGFLPISYNSKNRKEEIVDFLEKHRPSKYLIIDDDKSLHELNEDIKRHVILTELQIGFNDEKLREATQKLFNFVSDNTNKG